MDTFVKASTAYFGGAIAAYDSVLLAMALSGMADNSEGRAALRAIQAMKEQAEKTIQSFSQLEAEGRGGTCE